MSRRPWLRHALLASCLALWLAGCAASHPVAPPTAAPHPTATAPRPTATPRPLPPLADLTLPPAISARAAFVLDAGTGTVRYAYQPDTPRAMASTTKIMTAVVAILSGKLEVAVTVGNQVASIDPSQDSVVCCPTLQPGEVFTVRELLYGLLLPSGDDAALLIADAVAGSPANFVAQMNVYAALLGLRHTHYVNPHGLDAPGHVTTARDLARLTAFAMTIPLFRAIVGRARYTIPGTSGHPPIALETTNVLLNSDARLGVDGVKTGYTGDAGYCLVVDAQRQGRHLIIVLLGEPTDSARFADATALLTWALGTP